jgi:hypothetical protein
MTWATSQPGLGVASVSSTALTWSSRPCQASKAAPRACTVGWSFTAQRYGVWVRCRGTESAHWVCGHGSTSTTPSHNLTGRPWGIRTGRCHLPQPTRRLTSRRPGLVQGGDESGAVLRHPSNIRSGQGRACGAGRMARGMSARSGRAAGRRSVVCVGFAGVMRPSRLAARPTRRIAASLAPPIQMGGPPAWAGGRSAWTGGKVKISLSHDTGLVVHHACRNASVSSSILPRRCQSALRATSYSCRRPQPVCHPRCVLVDAAVGARSQRDRLLRLPVRRGRIVAVLAYLEMPARAGGASS